MKREPARVFPEIEEYREMLEIKHLRAKNHFVLLLLALGGILTILYMAITHYQLAYTLSLAVAFSALILLNLACLAYGRENIRFNQLNKFVTTLGVFSVAVAMIFIFQSPSMLSLLFIAYAIAAFYQDRKVMLISNVSLLFMFLALMTNFRDFFKVENTSAENDFGLYFFVIIFISLLTISQYIMIKQKGFFYNQIAISRETEFRNIDFMIDMCEKATGSKIDTKGYFAAAEAFSKALSEKIGVDDAFAGKLAVLKDLEAGTKYERIIEKHPEVAADDLDRMSELLFTGRHKLRKVAIKMSRARAVDVHRREIFSETQFKTFNHPSDTLEIKIIAFAIFYAALKRGSAGMRPLSEAEIYDAIVHTDYYFYNDPAVMRIYRENNAVFDAIVKDAFAPEGGK
ncbi:MAG TPA: hypothetical protein DCR44_08050 [Acholeplasmatales bacterium]|nr:hypothetical protein [Acholeplasmatales bacterium]